MMKILSILLTICALGSFQPDRANPQIVLEMLRDGNGRMLYMMCDDNVRSSVDAGQLSSLWKGIESQMGLYVSNSAWYGLDGVPGGKWCNISFENGKAALVLVYGLDGRIAGLRIAPALPEPAPDEEFSDIHELAEGWEEKELAVHTGKFKLPARLTVPRQKAPDSIPVLILVPGSGPDHKDDTRGPHKLFKATAAAMSHRGIAVLRYDKRTYVYGEKAFANPEEPTIEEECTDDALSAASLADSLGFERIFIIGHSLGAGMAPYIAASDTDGLLDGIIMLAAPASTMAETIEHQIGVLGNAYNREELARIRKTFMELPQKYIEGVDYDKKAVMAGLCAKAFPMLFLQGGRDYQVPAEEIRIWEAWVDEAGGNADARFISYPGLNHIFHKGEGEPSPAEYAVQGKIPGEVLDDIAGFLKIRL